ncbi:MAG: M6 family metalloprotease domain-containing protein [Candidatus Krumholzibacteria bacterium]|nr:M6 family metalloprotease domain-containing protein [Candidatus Krumholzibacteria bacterium]
MRPDRSPARARARALTVDRKLRVLFIAGALLLAGALLWSTAALGVIANPEPVAFRQPDGTEVKVFLRGDEHFHWNEDGTGFPVVRSADGTAWVYAAEKDGLLVPTSVPAGSVDPLAAGLVRPDMTKLLRIDPDRTPMLMERDLDALAPPTGTMKNLVVLVNYSDLSITSTTAEFSNLFNQIGYSTDGAAGSVKDYYDEISYGALDVQSTVVEPVTLANGYAYYGANDAYGNDLRPRLMVSQALAALEARGFDFSTVDGDGDGWVDGLTIIHAGGGEEYSGNDPNYIWSHAWALSSTVTYDGTSMRQYHTEPARRGWDTTPSTWGITRIGVICHETGHFIGLPDLYDYGYDSRGVGKFCLMAGGSWNGDQGASPAHMSAWCKVDLGWVVPTPVAGGGVYTALQVETNAQIYKLQGSLPGNEYFLVENRQGVGFDAALPGAQRGLLVWHVDEDQTDNDDQTHYLVDLEEASGRQHLELNENSGEDSDYYREGNATEFTATTTPNNLGYGGTPLGLDINSVGSTGPMMSFTINGLDITLTYPDGGESLEVGSVATVAWTVGGDAPDSVSIELSIDGGASWPYPVASGITGTTTYGWTVPNLPVSTARLKVIAWTGGSQINYDASDGDFTISGNPYRYVSPGGGNVWPYSLPAWAAHDIRDAIDAASPGDSIMVAGATYAYAVPVDRGVHLMGGWDAAFASRDPAANVTTIQSNGSAVSFVSIPSGNPGIEGFTITGGTGTSAMLPLNGIYGGGVYVYSSAPTVIKGNVITNCGYTGTTGFSGGGAIACYNGAVTITGNEITGCRAQSGGAVYLYQAEAVIAGNVMSGASPNASYTGTKNGGGIYALHSDVTMTGNVIRANTGYVDGGGIYARLSPVSSSGDSIRDNIATGPGGGICADRSPLSMSNSRVHGNSTPSLGGGIYVKSQGLDIANSVVALNASGSVGGGIYADSTWGSIASSTFDRNSGVYAGGNAFISAAGPTDVRGNLFTAGEANGFEAAGAGPVTFQYNGLYGNTPTGVVGLTPDATNTAADPLYADAASLDYHLGVHSGAIDAGDPLAGDPDGSRADHGAFGGPGALFAAPSYVQNLADAASGDTLIELTWDGRLPGGLDYYAIYADTAAGFAPGVANFIGTTAAANSSFEHHPVAGCLYYRVNLVDADGYAGGYSNVAGACAAGPDVTPPTVTVTYPAGGESFSQGDTIAVLWTASDDRQVDSVSVWYSADGGAAWLLIAGGEPNDGTYRWIAPAIASDSCLVRVVAFDPAMHAGVDESDSLFTIQGATGDETPALAFALSQNYPNPFNPVTTIVYQVGAGGGAVSLRIFDVSGRLVRTLVGGMQPEGSRSIVWNGTNDRGAPAASGIYFYRMQAPGFSETRKMILLR